MIQPRFKTRVEFYRRIFDAFTAPVSRFDCGRKCAPHNDGVPFCCSTDHAVPILDKAEYALLRSRSDLWRPYRASTAAGRAIIAELDEKRFCGAECRGAKFCERENRSLSCRAFPFFPYVTRGNGIAGLTYSWDFETRCWVISHLEIVTPDFIRECLAAYQAIIDEIPGEFESVRERSISMRRQFTRWNRPIPLLAPDGSRLVVEPRTHVIRAARPGEYRRHGPYCDDPGLKDAE